MYNHTTPTMSSKSIITALKGIKNDGKPSRSDTEDFINQNKKFFIDLTNANTDFDFDQLKKEQVMVKHVKGGFKPAKLTTQKALAQLSGLQTMSSRRLVRNIIGNRFTSRVSGVEITDLYNEVFDDRQARSEAKLTSSRTDQSIKVDSAKLLLQGEADEEQEQEGAETPQIVDRLEETPEIDTVPTVAAPQLTKEEILENRKKAQEINELEASLRKLQDPSFGTKTDSDIIDDIFEESANEAFKTPPARPSSRGPTVMGVIVDEPRPAPVSPSGIGPTVMGQVVPDFSKTDTESRLDQVDYIFQQLSGMPGIPEDIKKSVVLGERLIAKATKEGKPKDSIFKSILRVSKKVLHFIAVAPLPIPEEIKLGAAGILTAVEGVEQVASIAKGETSDTSAVSAALEVATGIPEIAPVIEVAAGIVEVVDAGLKIRDSLLAEQKGKSAVDSTPIPVHLLGGGLSQTKAVQETVINRGVIDGQGVSTKVQVPTEVDEIRVPITGVDGHTISPTEANSEIATAAGEGTPAPSVLDQPGVSTARTDEVPQITQGDTGTITPPTYKDPIHPDALGIYFGSSSSPKWDDTLLKDRQQRFADISPESTRSYLLQQSRMIWDMYKVDLLIPRLMFDESSPIDEVVKENAELMQLWGKLKGVASAPSSDTVGVSIGDLLKFRGLLTSDAPTVPAVAPVAPPTDPSTPTDPSVPATPATPAVTQPIGQPIAQRHPQDHTNKFNYSNVSGIRLWPVTDDATIEAARVPTLAQVVTAQGAVPLSTRSNMTRGFQHSGPVARGHLMDGLRVSAIGTQASEPAGAGYSRQGRNLDQNVSETKFNVRI